jgi:hypothetical protein
MATARRLVPWSKRTDELVRYVALQCRPRLQSELGGWIEAWPRFAAFVSANQAKIRKKLTSAADEEARLDVRAELLVVCLLLIDRRFEVAFEAYGAHQAAPDLTVSYRTHQCFNLEVTRWRGAADVSAIKLASVVAAKTRQLPADVPNALVITGRELEISAAHLTAAATLLKAHTDHKHDAFFARRGLKDARDFYAHYLRLAGIFLLDEATPPKGALFVPNRDARRTLPTEALGRLTACLGKPTLSIGREIAPTEAEGLPRKPGRR